MDTYNSSLVMASGLVRVSQQPMLVYQGQFILFHLITQIWSRFAQLGTSSAQTVQLNVNQTIDAILFFFAQKFFYRKTEITGGEENQD